MYMCTYFIYHSKHNQLLVIIIIVYTGSNLKRLGTCDCSIRRYGSMTSDGTIKLSQNIKASIHTYIHTYVHTYIHTYIHTHEHYTQAFMYNVTQLMCSHDLLTLYK